MVEYLLRPHVRQGPLVASLDCIWDCVTLAPATSAASSHASAAQRELRRHAGLLDVPEL